MVFFGFERFWDQNVGHHVAACGGLWWPVPPNRAGLDPPNIKISDSGGLYLKAWCLDACMLKDWNGLGEVTEMTALWGEGIGRNSHTLKLQELGRFVKTPSNADSTFCNYCCTQG